MRLGATHLLSVLGDWSTRPGTALHRQLAAALVDAIESGLLPPGSMLPPERRLATVLAVSRSTVSAALDVVKATGWVEARQGSGTVVVGGGPDGLQHGSAGPDAVVLPGLLAGRTGIDLAVSIPGDAQWVPTAPIGAQAMARHQPGHGYAPAGLPALRQAIADRFRARGVATDPAEVMVTNGGHHGLVLALGSLCEPGSPVLVDDPGYPGLADLLAAAALTPVAVPRRAGGVGPSALRDAAVGNGAQVACLQPLVHNPTGAVAEEWELRRLAQDCRRLGLTVVEDLVLEDLRFDGPAPPSLAGRLDGVVSVGSLSKSIWGGLRVGWLRADAGLIRRLGRRRLPSDLGSAVPSQLLALAALAQGDDLLRRRRAQLRARCERLASLLHQQLPEWQLSPAAGGLSLWLTLPAPVAEPFAQLAARDGVLVATGQAAATGSDQGHHLRLCFDRPEAQLAEAVARLAGTWRRCSFAVGPQPVRGRRASTPPGATGRSERI